MAGASALSPSLDGQTKGFASGRMRTLPIGYELRLRRRGGANRSCLDGAYFFVFFPTSGGGNLQIHATAPTATMPKTGWKFTKQAPAKGSTNMLKRSNASSKQGRRAPKGHGNDSNMRSAETIARLKMYNNGKAIRNKEGKVVGGQFMMGDRAGDTKITSCE